MILYAIKNLIKFLIEYLAGNVKNKLEGWTEGVLRRIGACVRMALLETPLRLKRIFVGHPQAIRIRLMQKGLNAGHATVRG